MLPMLCQSLKNKRIWGCDNSGGSLVKLGIIYGAYASDIQNERYPENLYVYHGAEQMYQLYWARTAPYRRKMLWKAPGSTSAAEPVFISGHAGQHFPVFYFCAGSV